MHTDLAADPATYAGPNVFTYAAGRSFYERLFPDNSVMLGWSSTAVLWLSHTPGPIPDHLFSHPPRAPSPSSGPPRHRAAELRAGAQLVVTALVADPEVRPWMATVEQGGRDAVDDGVLTATRLEAMVVPTILRDADERAASVTEPFEVVDRRTVQAPDPAYAAYEAHHDPARYAAGELAAFRAWSEAVLTPGVSRAAADGFSRHVEARLADKPVACPWRIGLMRIRRR